MKIEFSEEKPPSPLADILWPDIFANAKVAGMAARSFVSAVLGDDIGEVASINEFPFSEELGIPRSAVDVKVWLKGKAFALYEIQIASDLSVLDDNLLSASYKYLDTKGMYSWLNLREGQMNKLTFINILESGKRGEESYLEPIDLAYRNPPFEAVYRQLSMYNIQLSTFSKSILAQEAAAKPGETACYELNSPLDHWVFALLKAHENHQSMKEVTKAYPQLQSFSKVDRGFAQFCERFDFVANEEDVFGQYVNWVRGIAEGRRHVHLLFTYRLHAAGYSAEQVSDLLKLPIEEINEYLHFLSN